MQTSYSNRILKVQDFLPKHYFFFTLETFGGNVESIYAKVAKHIKKGGESWSWSELTMNNWPWIVLIVYLYPGTI